MARQGAHHVAQKSMRTGCCALSTSASKFESVTVVKLSDAMFTPDSSVARGPVADQMVRCAVHVVGATASQPRAPALDAGAGAGGRALAPRGPLRRRGLPHGRRRRRLLPRARGRAARV